jgi:AcrR family transcriptional regulator
MVEKRRKPGRPAYGSREKLIAATCALLAERGFEATSPTMILKRSGVGHGSMYHYFDGKEDLAVAAMDHLRTRTFAILRTASEEAASDDDAAEDSDSTPADMDAHWIYCSPARRVRRCCGCWLTRQWRRVSRCRKRCRSGATKSAPSSSSP